MLEWQTDLGAYRLNGLITADLTASKSAVPRLALHGWLDNAASMAGLLTALNAMHPAPSLALISPATV